MFFSSAAAAAADGGGGGGGVSINDVDDGGGGVLSSPGVENLVLSSSVGILFPLGVVVVAVEGVCVGVRES